MNGLERYDSVLDIVGIKIGGNGPDRGWTWIETYFTAQFFTNNNNFFANA